MLLEVVPGVLLDGRLLVDVRSGQVEVQCSGE
jgi:hypothetical protein